MSKDQAKADIKNLTAQAIDILPTTLLHNLPQIEGMPGVPDWHEYERTVWALGEQIRQVLAKHKTLNKDTELLNLFLQVSLNANAKRGRQSFLMLLAHKHCQGYAPQIISQINDEFVCGHVIWALNKMQAAGHASVVEGFTEHKVTWIRNEAKKYMAKYG